MQKQALLYAGKAKSVYETDNPDYLILHFRNDASAFNGEKIAQLRPILSASCLMMRCWSNA